MTLQQPNVRYVFVCDGQIVVPHSSASPAQPVYFWSTVQAEQWLPLREQLVDMGQYDERQYHAASITEQVAQKMMEIGAAVVPLRSLMEWGEQPFALAGRGVQLLRHYRETRYCGYCGGTTEPVPGEMAVHCGPCNHSYYPRLSPCAIMLVTRGDHCLLARHGGGRGDYFTCLAGFVEPGEPVEYTVQREVFEEVGVSIKTPHYFSSQYWPFPGQLMLGFYAEYDRGELAPDGVEIVEADWFHYSELPPHPSPYTLSGQLIQGFVSRHSK